MKRECKDRPMNLLHTISLATLAVQLTRSERKLKRERASCIICVYMCVYCVYYVVVALLKWLLIRLLVCVVSEIRNISNAINQTLEELETTKSDVDDCATLLGASDPRCVRAELVIEYIQTNTTALELELGTAPSLIDENGNSSEGFLYLVSCSALNGRYQNMLNVFCGDGAEALGLSAGIFVGFALIYLFSQIISRIVSDVGRDEDDDVKII
eukprot:m.94680 g.94680  ORF g.94680 m.94680 type:complete len:213 (-) comp12420_c0_seq4:3304-3942(-)